MKKKSILLLLSTMLVAISPNKLEVFKDIKEKHLSAKIVKSTEQQSKNREERHLEKASTIDMTRGDVEEGERIFIKYFQKNCEQSAISFAAAHSQDEWEVIVQAGEFENEVLKLCPNVKKSYKKRWSPHLYQFVYEYANDSGNIPSF